MWEHVGDVGTWLLQEAPLSVGPLVPLGAASWVLADGVSKFLYQAAELPLLGGSGDRPNRTSALSQSATRPSET